MLEDVAGVIAELRRWEGIVEKKPASPCPRTDAARS
jgi:hypothetical protein